MANTVDPPRILWLPLVHRILSTLINNCNVIAAPLALLKLDAFRWTDIAIAAFEALKAALTCGPILQLPDFTAPFVIGCDTLGTSFSAVLH
jgi:hypothetical protein